MIVNIFYSEKDALIFALEDLQKQLNKEFDDFDFLIFSFHPKYNYNDINYFVNKIFKTDKWIGFHSIDSFSDDKIIMGIVVLAIKFENDAKIDTFSIENIDEKEALGKTADFLNKNKEKLNLIIGNLCDDKIGFFIEDLSRKLTYSPINNIVGGIASGFKENNEVLTYIFTPQKIIKNGLIILSLSRVDFEIGIALGFKPYGVTYEIKKAEDCKIYTVDDDKSFSYIVQNLLKGINNFKIEYLWYCPINILDDKEGYVATLRTPKALIKDYVEFFGPVKKGQKFKFSFAENDELLEESKKIAVNIKNKISHPDLLLNFSCVARQYVLEDKKEEENKIYINILNNHLFGFFTFGEIGPDKFYKSLKFYNETSLLVAIKE